MKPSRLLALFIVLFILSVSPAASQVPDDKLITPGVGIGRWTLQMTLAQLLQMNGPAAVSPGRGLDYNRSDVWVHEWPPLGLAASVSGSRDSQRVDVLIASLQDYRTAKGVSPLVKRDVLEAAYGKPTAVTQATASNPRLIYDELGLWARLDGTSNTVVLLGVFRPGTGRQLWKF